MRFNNKRLGKSETYYVITDKLSPHTIAVYELIKSLAGFEYFDLTLHQIAKARGMSYGKAQESFKKLKELGIIKLKNKTGYWEGDEYDICDEQVADAMDPDRTYNKERRNILGF